MVKKNDEITLEITDMDTKGSGIGKETVAESAGKTGADTSCGFTFFVKGALVGDLVRARVTKVKKNYGYARAEKILRPSPCRTTPRCPVAGKCGGCQLQHCTYAKQLDLKQKHVKDALTHIGGFSVALPGEKPSLPEGAVVMEPMLSMKDPYHYRNKTQLPVAYLPGAADKKDTHGKIVAGFYVGRTHAIIPQTDCAIAHPCTTKVADAVLLFLKRYHIKPYEEKTGTGLVRHIVIRVGPFTGQIMVCLVLNGKTLPQEKELIATLLNLSFPGGFSVASICINVNTARTNVILGETVRLLYGKDYIEDVIGDIRFRISLRSFYQVNSVQTKKLYETALDFAGLTGTETVWDIYCGIGTISLFLARRAKKVYGVEAEKQAVKNAKKNAEINGIKNVTFICGEAEKVLPLRFKESGGTLKADVVTLDPPRKGCERALLDAVIGMGPQKIVYVSCDPATLARDLSVLCANGYALKRVKPCDMFPQTVHVETVTLLEKTVPYKPLSD